MKTTTSYLLLGLLLFLSSCNKNTSDIDGPSNGKLIEPMKIDLLKAESKMVQSNHDFAFQFFAKVFDEELNDRDNNFMVSPFSLSMALAMTWNGSAGDTKQAIQNTLGFDSWPDNEVNSYFKKLKSAFEKTDPSTQLSIANSIWTNKSVKIAPNFVLLNQDYYNATVEAVDFSNPNTVDRINKWAADNTNNLIKSVIEETDNLDLMYLLNALYFKGVWSAKFDAKSTTKMDFTEVGGTKTKVDMMQQKTVFNYADNETMQVVELPYGNKAFSMMVLLPKTHKKLTDIAHALQHKTYWNNLKNKMSSKEVDLFLPKFKTKYSKKLNNVLIDMGMGVAFTAGEADFTQMSDRDAFISFVSQHTFIATDEVGTEAAAVTVVGIKETSAGPSPDTVTFKANRPFIYVIHEKSTGSVLFMGAIKKF